MLDELLTSIGKLSDDDPITYEVFARCVALLLEENAEKAVSTSSQQNYDDQGEGDGNDYGEEEDIDAYGEEAQYAEQ